MSRNDPPRKASPDGQDEAGGRLAPCGREQGDDALVDQRRVARLRARARVDRIGRKTRPGQAQAESAPARRFGSRSRGGRASTARSGVFPSRGREREAANRAWCTSASPLRRAGRGRRPGAPRPGSAWRRSRGDEGCRVRGRSFRWPPTRMLLVGFSTAETAPSRRAGRRVDHVISPFARWEGGGRARRKTL